ncbi:MAG: mannose-1-phosphate guanylyltransferase/mannose-6-phosphate isomerase [Alphaproteobacteria bacterium]|nr:mannose-1-phosphate guanylyltransferase/mannose-6-phosphate isomerase [Alphaproteobacteria bacterium]
MSTRKNETKIVPVILCGGSGTRLWPASREKNPKQFLNLMGDFSLLQDTARRALKVSGAEYSDLVTVTLGALRRGVEAQMMELHPAAANHILSEPCARNTAAAVALAAHYVASQFGEDAVMWILPADHHIADEKALEASLDAALEAAAKGYLVTFGIQPTRPETGYGYIRLGEALMGENVRRAAAFVEKPNLQTAREYLDAGVYLWNSGMFLLGAGVVLKEFEKHSADVLAGVRESVKGMLDPREASLHRYETIPNEPFDVAIMEKSLYVAVVPSNPAWSDIGSWESLWEIREKDENGNVTEGRTACVDTNDCLVQAKERLVACAGVKNIVVIETGDAVLIADRSNGDAMKKLVKTLKATGCRETQEMTITHQPVLNVVPDASEAAYGVREIVLSPGQVMSFAGEENVRRFLTIIEGSALATTIDGQKQLNPGQNLFIETDKVYRLKNNASVALVIVEVQKPLEEQSYTQESVSIRNVA